MRKGFDSSQMKSSSEDEQGQHQDDLTPQQFEEQKTKRDNNAAQHVIPYPACSFSLWNPLGQLLTVHNSQPSKVVDQRCELLSLKDINNYIYPSKRRKTIEVQEINNSKQNTLIQGTPLPLARLLRSRRRLPDGIHPSGHQDTGRGRL